MLLKNVVIHLFIYSGFFAIEVYHISILTVITTMTRYSVSLVTKSPAAAIKSAEEMIASLRSVNGDSPNRVVMSPLDGR